MIAVSLLGTGTAAQGDNQGAKETFQVMPLNETMGSGDSATGAIRLNRARNELRASVHVTDLNPGSPFTIWAVVFNEPGECTTNPAGPVRCSATDLMAVPNPARASAFNVGAFLSDSTGTANSNLHIHSGPPPEGAFVLWGQGGMFDNGVSPGLHQGNGFRSEVHLVIRAHGALLADHIAAQLSLLNGGCPPNPPANCANVQVATFPRVTD